MFVTTMNTILTNNNNLKTNDILPFLQKKKIAMLGAKTITRVDIEVLSKNAVSINIFTVFMLCKLRCGVLT